MYEKNHINMKRRTFISSVSTLAAAGAFLLPDLLQGKKKTKPGMPEQLSPEEIKMVNQSLMAKDMSNYFGKGYSCAESILMVSLNFLGLKKELLWAAAGFGGGLLHRDLCGFLTGGIMGIGFAAGQLNMERKQAKRLCSAAVKKYWKWWQTVAPLHCSEIRPPKSSKLICSRLGQISAARVESLIKSLKA
jgi:hypothetical protein